MAQVASSLNESQLRLGRGEWIVACYRGSCPVCRENLPVWLAIADSTAAGITRGPSWAFVDVDPAGLSDPLDSESPTRSLHVRLEKPWIPTPLLLRISAGQVLAASDRIEGIEP